MKRTSKILALAMTVAIGFVPSVSEASAESEQCAKEILVSHFPREIILETLEKFGVPSDSQLSILSELTKRENDVVSIVEKKAGEIDPNPLRDPEQRKEAVKIFRETIYEIFAQVLKNHGIENDQEIHAMLEDIKQNKAKRLAECMGNFESKESYHTQKQPKNESGDARENSQ